MCYEFLAYAVQSSGFLNASGTILSNTLSEKTFFWVVGFFVLTLNSQEVSDQDGAAASMQKGDT